MKTVEVGVNIFCVAGKNDLPENAMIDTTVVGDV